MKIYRKLIGLVLQTIINMISIPSAILVLIVKDAALKARILETKLERLKVGRE